MAKGNKTHKLMAAGTATLIAEPALAFAHQGGLGVIVGLVAGAVAYGILDDIEQRTGGHLTFPTARSRPAENGRAALEGKQNLAHRLLVGKSVREEAAGESDDTVFVDEEENERVETLYLGHDLVVHVDTIFSNRVVIFGMSGGGKSNLLAVILEELGSLPDDAPILVFDYKPEYGPLCDRQYLRRACPATAETITVDNARARGAEIMAKRMQVVLDLTTYRSDAEAALVMLGLLDGIEWWQRQHENDGRIPATIVLEEAQHWLPENEAHSTLRGRRHPQTGESLLAAFQQVFFRVAKVGRSLGMGLIVATQRPAALDKEIASQAPWRFFLKTMDPSDLKAYRAAGVPSDEIAQGLDPKAGEAYVLGPEGVRGVFHIRRRESPDMAKSPGLSNLRRSPRQIALPVSPFPRFQGEGGREQGNGISQTFPGNGETGAARPPERVPDVSLERERFSAQRNAPAPLQGAGPVEAEDDEVEGAAAGFTNDEMAAVLRAYRELLTASNGGRVSRRAIRDHLGWGGKKYQRVIRPVCDAAGIAMDE